jgi:hypothetical protein
VTGLSLREGRRPGATHAAGNAQAKDRGMMTLLESGRARFGVCGIPME